MEGNLASTVDICPDNRIGRSSSFGRVSHVFFSMAAAAIAMEKEGRRFWIERTVELLVLAATSKVHR